MLRSFSCNSARELLDALTLDSEYFRTSYSVPRIWIFRGQGNAAWQLRPSAFRDCAQFLFPSGWSTVRRECVARARPGQRRPHPYGPPSEDFLQVAGEVETLTAFFLQADAAGLPLPEDTQRLRSALGNVTLIKRHWPPDEVLSLMALAQHYRLPTRLLDWTWNARVACFFAATSCLKPHQCSEALCPYTGTATAMTVWALRVTDFQHLTSRPPARGRGWVQLVTAPAASNDNLRAQQGVFTLFRAKTLQHTRLPLDAFVDGHAGYLVFRFDLPKAEVPHLLRLLALEGVTAASVYPGYDGVVASLRGSKDWDLPAGS